MPQWRMRSYFKWIYKKMPVLVSLVVLLLAVSLKGGQSEFVTHLQHQVFDQYQKHFPREYQDAGVKIIDIDDESLARLGQWPWPRTLVARLVDRLSEMGAAPIAFDIVFAEPDRTSPKHMAEFWQTEGDLRSSLEQMADHDAVLQQSFAQAYVIAGTVLMHEDRSSLPEIKATAAYAGEAGAKPSDHIAEHYGAAITNLKQLDDAAEGIGFFNNVPDADGIIRRVPLLLIGDDEEYFSLAMEALRVAQGATNYLVKMAGANGEQNLGVQHGITHIRNGAFDIPTDEQGRLRLYYTPYQPERYVPAWKILEDDFDASQIEGRMVFVGTSAPGLLDLRATPLNPSLPGVEVHVQALEQILLGEFLYRPRVVLGLEVTFMLLGGLLMMWIMAHLTAVWGAVFMLGLQLGSLGGSVYAFTSHGWIIDPVMPSITVLLLYISESLRRYLHSEAERKQVRGAFSQYMSPALVERLAKEPERLKLGGEMRELTMLFADIRGFTTISEQFDAQELTEFINSFLTPMTEVILQRHGTIDKYMGDCIMAFWNAPLEVREHAREGCLSALEMLTAVKHMNQTREQLAKTEGKPYLPIHIGIGLNTGSVCVGNMGADQRFDYSVLGDPVNLASRLEGQSKSYGVDVVIGEHTQAEVTDLATLELDLIKVKGKTEAVRIFALLGNDALADSELFLKLKPLWQQMLDSYRLQDWDGAENYIKLCETVLEKTPELSLAGLFELYRERLRGYRLQPPEADWDGVFTATSK